MMTVAREGHQMKQVALIVLGALVNLLKWLLILAAVVVVVALAVKAVTGDRS